MDDKEENFNDEIDVEVLEEVEEQNISTKVESTCQQISRKYCTGPWDRLSKRQKTLIIIVATGIIIFGLIIAILIPLTKTSTGTRNYYIKAEEITWDYAPEGENVVKGRPFNQYEAQFAKQMNNRIGSMYKKAQFIGYTDETFTEPIETPKNEIHTGIIGPIIRAEVGEIIKVTILNELPFNISFHISGLQYSKENEGIAYNDNVTDSKGAVIQTGQNYTYTFPIAESDGPASTDFSSVSYNYYSTNDVVGDYNTGLCGVVVITKKGSAREDGTPDDVGFEGFLLASVFDENKSLFFEDNISQYLLDNSTIDSDGFYESNRKYAINGYLYGNMPSVDIQQGDRVRWYISALGEGTHTLLWSGQTLLSIDGRSGSIVIYPGTTFVADSVPLVAGTWLLESYGLEAKNGMSTLYNVISVV